MLRLVDWFLPRGGAGCSRDEMRQGRILVALHLPMFPALAIMAIRAFAKAGVHSVPAWATVLIALSLSSILAMPRLMGRVRPAAIRVVIESALAIGLVVYLTQGLAGPVYPWLLLIPALAALVVGPRLGLVMAAVTTAEIALFFGLHKVGHVFPAGTSFGPGEISDWHVIVFAVEAFTFGCAAAALAHVARRTNAALAESEARYRQLFEANPMGIAVVDARGCYSAVNAAFQHLCGVTALDLVGQRFAEFPPPPNGPGEAARALDRVRGTNSDVETIEEARLHRDGSVRVIRTHIDAIRDPTGFAGALVCSEDVTAVHRLEDRMRLTERLASLGTLAAGIAHEINNPLSYVEVNLDLVADGLSGGAETLPARREELCTMLVDARHGAERIGAIVRKLKTFGRAERRTHRPVDLVEVLALSLQLASNEIRHRAEVVRNIVPVSGVIGDAAELSQVFVNLLINAAHAIPLGRVEENRITVSVGQREQMALVSVSDTGCGIAASARPRLFDPFFTTKPVGEGTGLGLSIAHGIVTEHGGQILVHSEAGKGSTFEVLLPMGGSRQLETKVPDADVPAAMTPRRILVVDDEILVAASLARLLRGTRSAWPRAAPRRCACVESRRSTRSCAT
ncbi:MAG: PAS domain S-box protein [Deltaproteobacteria bacterium]|nr:PAS domain S-box protein [Deltaproteobacteria bacterium]